MTNRDLLVGAELQALVDSLKGWEKDNNLIRTERVFADFVSAIGFINAVAILSEAMDHHPDIKLYAWNKVRLELSTHDKGGLTRLDFDLADKINAIGF